MSVKFGAAILDRHYTVSLTANGHSMLFRNWQPPIYTSTEQLQAPLLCDIRLPSGRTCHIQLAVTAAEKGARPAVGLMDNEKFTVNAFLGYE